MKRRSSVSAEIVDIGNSKGVRIPKPIREQAGLRDKVTLSVEDGAVVIRPARRLREGWRECLARAGAGGPEDIVWPEDTPTEFDETEWTW
jgi:antitoxin MazE